MFLFGLPTPKILDIITKMYHENVVRNLLRDNIPAYEGQKGTRLGESSKQNPDVSFMCGMIEMNDGEIYITISESPIAIEPGVKEDNNFNKKEATLRKMLQYCNIDVSDAEIGNDNAEKVYSNNSKENVAWRYEVPRKIDVSQVLSDNGCKKIHNDVFIAGCDSHNYDNNIYEGERISVKLINSFDYLRRRRNTKTSFVPFKKYDVNSGKIECNNGSTCTESKLFSFVYDKLNKTFDDIKGIGVVWIGNKLPPNHHLKNYCYF
jgi:hypothetical protein